MPGIWRGLSLRYGSGPSRSGPGIRVHRMVQHIVHRAGFDHAACIHDANAISQPPIPQSCVIQISAVPVSRQSFCIS